MSPPRLRSSRCACSSPRPTAAPFLPAKLIASQQPLIVAPGATADLNAETTIANPDRWDIGHGAMYTVHATLLRDGKPVDDEAVPFGIREFHFDADQGFFLNGVHHKVLGVALHTDGGAVGTAVPLAVWERRLTELRKLGVNAIRTAHNPPAPEFLDLADRMGFLVMDEMFDCWTVAKNPYDYHLYFKDWYIRDTTDTVMRDRNHPSIILWSAGNEIHDTPQPEVAIPILKSLVATFHQNDPTRPVTQALFRPNASHDYEDGLADLLDVVGQNYRDAGDSCGARAEADAQDHRHGERARPRPVDRRARPRGVLRPVPVERHRLPGRVAHLADHRLRLRPAELPSRCRMGAPSSARAGGPPRRWSPWCGAPPSCAPHPSIPATPTPPASTSPRLRGSLAQPRRAQPALAEPVRRALRRPIPRCASPSRCWPTGRRRTSTPHTENVEVYTNAEEVELFLNGKSLGTAEAPPRRQRHHLQGSVRAGNAEGGRAQRQHDRCHRGAEDGGQTGAARLHRG